MDEMDEACTGDKTQNHEDRQKEREREKENERDLTIPCIAVLGLRTRHQCCRLDQTLLICPARSWYIGGGHPY